MEQKVIVITGAGGVLCSGFAKVLAKEGHKVALLDLNLEAAEKFAAEIRAEGGIAKAYGCNVLKKESMEEAHQAILADFGKCDILINGAGGNNPRGTADHETYEPGDETRDDIKTFFNLDPDGIGFVFNLNFLGTLLPTQVFVPDMIGKEGCSILNISSMNAFRRKGCHFQLYPVACRTLRSRRNPCKCHRSRLLRNQSEQSPSLQ